MKDGGKMIVNLMGNDNIIKELLCMDVPFLRPPYSSCMDSGSIDRFVFLSPISLMLHA